ncbi:sodium-coupled monocarboxylate transporter 1 [Trichonephila clavipes]|nr:sodium-coupled monocarboxylate transporter 1 [Trichonephila clavipes]
MFIYFQIVPYYIVSRFIRYPGLVGLCISGILCASLSSLSSALNSLSTVFLEDFINPFLHIPYKTARLKLNACAKALVVIHGFLIIGLAFVTSQFTSVFQAVVVLDGMVLGPTLGVYVLGVLTETTNEMGILIGLIFGALFSAWFGLGTSLFGNKYEGLPLSSESCKTLQWNSTEYINPLLEFNEKTRNSSISEGIEKLFPMHGVSYIWTYCVGAILTITVSYIASFLINCRKETAVVDSTLLCPLRRPQNDKVSKEIELHSSHTTR